MSALQGNNEFLGELFQKLRSADTPGQIKKELVSNAMDLCFENVCSNLVMRHEATQLIFFQPQKPVWHMVPCSLQILFVQEFVNLSKHLQPPNRTRLFGWVPVHFKHV